MNAPARPAHPITLSRSISFLEAVLAAAVVLGHNVWRVAPNEVPILVVAGLVSTRLREGKWSALGFQRPKSWTLAIALALGATVTRLLVSDPIEAALSGFWPKESVSSVLASGPHDVAWLLSRLALVWTFAAFGEEISYRGYITKRVADVFGDARAKWWIATGVAAVLFGFGHYYKGPIGIVDSTMAGILLGAVYIISGRCLWTTILAHGLIDTTGIVGLYLGLSS